MITCLLAVSVLGGKSQAQDLLSNVYGRDYQLLNGKWGAIVTFMTKEKGCRNSMVRTLFRYPKD